MGSGVQKNTAEGKEFSIWAQFCVLCLECENFLYGTFTADVLSQIKMVVASSTYGEGGVYKVLVTQPEGKRPLGRPRCRWEDNINMDLQEVG